MFQRIMMLMGGVSVMAVGGTTAQADVTVLADQAKVFRLEEPADTIILGNPSIADVTVHDRVTIVVTGKSYGTTNLIVLNNESEPVVEEQITVSADNTGYVSLQKNIGRVTYSCNPDCYEVVRLGDTKAYLQDVAATISTRNKLAQEGAVSNGDD